MLLTIIAAVFVLGVVIFVHELGHFMAAKAAGVGVVRFSIGFGPATPLRFRRFGTEYVVSWIPLGGYVMMASEEEADIDRRSGAAAIEGGGAAGEGEATGGFPPDQVFERKPLLARFGVLVAGVTMNALFAWLVYAGLAAAYGRVEDPTTTVAEVDTTLLPEAAAAWKAVPLPATVLRVNDRPVSHWEDISEAVLDPTSQELRFQLAGREEPLVLPLAGRDGDARVALLQALIPRWEPRFGEVAPGRVADRAGLAPGDLVLRANDDSVRHWQQLVRVIEGHPGDTVVLVVLRDSVRVTVPVVPAPEEARDARSGATRTVGKIGVGVQAPMVRQRFGPVDAVVEGGRRVAADAAMVVFAVKGLVLGQISPRELGGPIFVGQLSGQLARVGLEPLLSFLALFSVNLAVLNLLPIPVLDGGRLVFLLAEGVLRRPLPRGLRIRLSQAGVALLLAVMLLALANDVLRIVGR